MNKIPERLRDLLQELACEGQDVCVADYGMRGVVVAEVADKYDGVAVVRLLVAERENTTASPSLGTCREDGNGVNRIFDEKESIFLALLAHLPLTG